MKQYRVVVSLEVRGEFEDQDDEDYIKESLGEQLDMALLEGDIIADAWKEARVEDITPTGSLDAVATPETP